MNNSDVMEYFGNTVNLDLFRLMLGDVVGNGVARVVYRVKHRPDLVAKIETGSHSFQNIKEWEFFNYWRHAEEVRDWLAPCEDISPCGTVMLQRRTTPVQHDQLPKKLPKFLTDQKVQNFGMLDGRLVCHDYGLVVVTADTALRKADWWGMT